MEAVSQQVGLDDRMCKFDDKTDSIQKGLEELDRIRGLIVNNIEFILRDFDNKSNTMPDNEVPLLISNVDDSIMSIKLGSINRYIDNLIKDFNELASRIDR